ncbi:golgin subfamily B member 1 isoform X2 [Gouania willdenowi]|uniref:golgin subfamily B member 1 isoform X2 n=1 Tax=Gouania willdenowi TaxID=441366 RepID=UPI0010545B6D|nr:golgin subfamily B member 1 isoform X2 [Gouania willdenowi]
MLSRLANVLQELSGEEAPDGDPEAMLVPQPPAGSEGQAQTEPEVPEDAMERLAHLEQLVVQLKEMIRDKDMQLVQKDTELVGKDTQLKNEKEEADARFNKLKLQAKAKMVSLNKQISDLKGQGGASSPESSFTSSAADPELQELRSRLSEEETTISDLRQRLQDMELLLQEKEVVHAEQLKVLQAVVCEKDERFQEQIQRHEEELLRATTSSQGHNDLQQALQATGRRCEELEDALNSRSQLLEMLQQEVSSADQQKQILTAQFRQMEQELAESVRLREDDRQKWAEQSSRMEAELAALHTSLEMERSHAAQQNNELCAMKEVELAAQDALERERAEVARLESELTQVKEAELKAVQASSDVSEEVAQLRSELEHLREAESETSEVRKLEKQVTDLREEHEGGVKKLQETLTEIWRHLRSLAPESEAWMEDVAVLEEPSLLLDTVRAVETRLTRLEHDCSEMEERHAQSVHEMETLQDELDRRSSEQEENKATIKHLQEQLVTLSNRSEEAERSQESLEAEKALVFSLQQQLLDKDNELIAVRESLRLATVHDSDDAEKKETCVQEESTAPPNSFVEAPELTENTQDEEDTTLVAEDTSVISVSAGNESSPELIGHQSESPEESKGTSSDEMVASSDSEVAQSSWTLLEAMNQDSSPEWPSVLQDFNQSWVATTVEQETSTFQVQSSSVVIRETVQVNVNQRGGSSADQTESSEETFVEELQRSNSELLSELQRLKEKIMSLEEEAQSFTAAREEAEIQASNLAEELKRAKEELENYSQHNVSMVEKHSVEMQLLEEQLDILNTGNTEKEQKIKALQTDLEMARQALCEQEGQARMLSAQLEDRELQLQEMDSSLLQYSQTSDLTNKSLSLKDFEISELHRQLSQKDQEMTELNVSMSAKLLQVEDEKLQSNSEVSKLKERIEELQKVGEDQQQVARDDSVTHVVDEPGLQKEKEVLQNQLVNAKKKLQVALVQRKEFMKKVHELEEELKKWKEKDNESRESLLQDEASKGHEVQQIEAKLVKLDEALKTKEEVIETLKQTIIQKDQVLTETLALNESLKEEVAKVDVSSEETALQSQLSSLQAECETLHKKLVEAQESRKETIRKAKEKDRHHREQLKQQKDEYNELMERFELQSRKKELILVKHEEQEEKAVSERLDSSKEPPAAEMLDKSTASDWVQEDWVDFAASETSSSKTESRFPLPCTAESDVVTRQMEESLKSLQDDIQAVRTENTELERNHQEALTSLSEKETEMSELSKELQSLREKEKQIDALSEELMDLREKHLQAERGAEALKAEMEDATRAAAAESTSMIASLQAEVEDFKQFLDNKNQEMLDLSEQLSEQSKLIHSMQDVVAQKDQLIFSLQEEVRAEQEKIQRLEVESPQKQEDDTESKIQHLQRKLQAALISRKDALKENKAQKEQLTSIEKTAAELQQKINSAEVELEKLREDKAQLSEELQKTLLDNQNLGSSCESLKLAMEGIISEKNACQRELKLAKDETFKARKEKEEKVKGMEEEYETLLRSYENVSDEAERVRKVLEAARQERQELAAKVKSQEAARQEAQRQAEESQKEVETMKDKMRKFAKTKQQKISDLEEENEKLRELQEKPVVRRQDKASNAEIQQLQETLRALKEELESSVTERESLRLQIEELKEQLLQTAEKTADVSNQDVQQSHAVVLLTEAPQSHSEAEEESSKTLEEQIVSLSAPEAEEKPGISESSSPSFEVKLKEMETAFHAEREQWQQREAELESKLTSFEQDFQDIKERESQVTSLERFLQESREREKSLAEEASQRETRVKDLLKSLEAEKDNLEERLMNQLAQLNGSIAGYQQEAAENREHLNELQRVVERLERERAELEAEARSERERASLLEEDMRQAQRERAEAEAQSGKRRELEQQLTSAQRVKEGSQSRAKQLEELLREKQLEVRQLQKDCIQYQERISELGRKAKAMQHSHHEIANKLDRSQTDISKTREELKKAEADLLSVKSQLEEAQAEANKANATKMALEQSIHQREVSLKAEAEETLDSVRFRLGAELKEMELRLEESYSDRDKEEEATLEARQMAADAEKRAQEVQARLDESLARLAAFSRCMSSLQDDRDRVVDEARQWESRFNGALQAKEAEIQEAETRVKDLTEHLRRESSLKEELQASVNRLEKADKDWQLKMDKEEKSFMETKAALEEETTKLLQTTAELQSAQTQARSLQTELEALSQRSRALEEAVAKLQDESEQARTALSEREAEQRHLCLSVEQLETDLRSSKVLMENLQSELHEKEQREVEMLGEKEQAVTQAAEEARMEADGRAREAEEQLEQKRGEVRDLEEQLRKAEEESNTRRAKLDSFMKAMGSLQDDRDRVLNIYRQLEEKHLQVMMEKDALIQEAATENNGLKEEMRSLLAQRDDLYAEKAKLSAQIHGYREELNQVLSLKESQHRAQLNMQRERISSLESQLRGINGANKEEQSVERETLSQVASQPVNAPGAEVEKLREQLQAARERAQELEATLQKEREAQESRDKELMELRWGEGVMRTESESAQERVGELAHDLLAVEQKLLKERETTKQLSAEKESFSKAMASLQDSRDQALSKVQELSLRLEEMSRTTSNSPGGSTGEVWGLKNALQALQNDRERLLEQLQTQTSELQKQRAELTRLGAGELIKVSQELLDQRTKNEDTMGALTQLQHVVETGKQEIETLRLERMDWMAQAEQLKQQTLVTLSERDQQLRQLSSLLQEARAQPKVQQETYQREAQEEVDSAPGAPQERISNLQDNHTYLSELKDLQRRLDEEMQQRMNTEEQLMILQQRLQRHPSTWQDADHSETAVFIEPPEGVVTRTRRSGPGLVRMLRVAFCSRQRTPLLFSIYVLVVHVLLLLCLSGNL